MFDPTLKLAGEFELCVTVGAVRDIADASPTAAPGCLEDDVVTDGEETADLRNAVRRLGFADGARELTQRPQKMLRCPGAMARLADEVKAGVIRQALRGSAETEELAPDSTVPSPGLEGKGRILNKLRELFGSDELAFHRQPELFPGVLCRIAVVDEHTVALPRPDGWEISEVMPQVSTCVRRGEVVKVRSKSQVVLRIKNVYSHRIFAKLKRKIGSSKRERRKRRKIALKNAKSQNFCNSHFAKLKLLCIFAITNKSVNTDKRTRTNLWS
jgi:hypothetical protein